MTGQLIHRPRRTSSVLRVMNQIASSEFDYGVMDCCQFTAAVVHAFTGRDYSASFAYHGQVEAEEIIGSYGSLRAMVSSILGLDPVQGGFENGDPIVVRIPVVGELLGVYWRGAVAVKTTRSIAHVPLRYAVEGWHIDE